jgi:DNA-binding NarL/FixJ family response regulator
MQNLNSGLLLYLSDLFNDMKKIKVVLVDDSKGFRESFKILLENAFNAEIIAEASDGNEFLALENAYKADIIFMDLNMAPASGWEAAKKYLEKYPYSVIVAVTMFEDKAYLKQLVEIGFKGCIYKNGIVDHLATAIDFVINGKFYFPHNINLTEL